MHIFPTRDLHLVRAFPDAQIDLTLCADWPPNAIAQTWTDLATLPNTTLVLAETPGQGAQIIAFRTNAMVPASPTGVSFRPGATDGARFVRVQAIVQGAGTLQTMIRVATHADVTRLFLPYGHLLLTPGRDDFVLTVAAEFSDGERWDISQHPWLEFDSEDHAIARVDRTGRVEAVAAGNTFVWVQPLGRPAARQRCQVTVQTVAQQQAASRIAVRRLERPASATGTIYLVSDGYVERERFENHAVQIKDRIFSEANAPFRWLKHRFAVTSVYVLSPGSLGITIGPPLDHNPVNGRARMFEAHEIAANGTEIFEGARLNAFGLMYGTRMGGPRGDTSIASNTPADALQSWLRAPTTRSVSVDDRRVGPIRGPAGVIDPRTSFERRFTELLTALGLPFGVNDRVVFVVDDQFRGGARLAVIGLEPRNNRFVALTIGAKIPFDGVTMRPGGSPMPMRVPQRDEFHADYVTSSIVHELGHTYGLGDEYEHERRVAQPSDGQRHAIEQYDNLQLLEDVRLGTVALDVRRIKWAVPRAKKVSLVRSIRDTFTPGSSIIVVVDGDATKLWTRNQIVRLRSSFATPRPRRPDGTVDVNRERLQDGSYQVQSVTGNEVTLLGLGVAPATHDDLRVLYEPIPTVSGSAHSDPTLLIDPLVVEHLKNHGVFPKPVGAECAVLPAARADIGGEPIAPPVIANLKMPTYREDLIGAYEGGNNIACGVIRPAGRCKMRKAADVVDLPGGEVEFRETWEFCFVCKFIIADRVDPTVLPKVQIHYPKDC